MNKDLSFNETELSAEDLAVLHAFDTLESWPTDSSPTDKLQPIYSAQYTPSFVKDDDIDDMLTVFLPEVEDDLSNMIEALRQLKQENYSVPAHFGSLQRLGHKLRGTAGAVGYMKMSEIASYIEIIAEQVTYRMLQPVIGSNAIAETIGVLESYLYKLVQDGEEPSNEAHIIQIQNFQAQFPIDLNQPIPTDDPTPSAVRIQTVTEDLQQSPTLTLPTHPQSIAVCAHRIDDLVNYTEKLFEQHISIKNAYKELETTIQDLQAAQAHFQRLGARLSTSVAQEQLPQLLVDHTSSSLITRILNNASSHDNTRKNKMNKMHQHTKFQRTSEWDELDIERYSEKDILLRSLREAMTNIGVSSTRLNGAYHTLLTLQQEYIANITLVRKETLMMRLAPVNTIISQLRDVVMTSMFAKEQQVDFEVMNDSIEIDQDVLSGLSPILMQMLQTCIANVTAPKKPHQTYRIWLSVQAVGDDASLEIGFSMAVHGGAVQTLREQIRLLSGSLSVERNTVGGLSFILRFPRMRGTTQCLLVRVSNQKLLIPLSHVQRVGYITPDSQDVSLYHLGSLLDIPTINTEHATIRPLVFIQVPMEYTEREPFSIQVDEIIDQVEFVVKPLKSFLQRTGITGAAIDGMGNVLLLLDIAELVRNQKQHIASQVMSIGNVPQNTQMRPLKILIADDAANIRRAVLQTLEHTNYEILEARDGLETLELLKSNTPDVLLLDIEMPYLNGYDILDIARHNTQFSNVKIIILTSRTSGKHRQYALELGAHAYLTKPSPQKVLLTTIQKVLTHNTL